jgi:hypothetical protein
MRVEGAPADGQAAQIVTESQNISASGVYCTSSHFLAPLSKVSLTIVLPRRDGAGRQELVKCEGIVVRCEPGGKRGDRSFELACAFTELDPKRRELIQQFVTWRNLQALRDAMSPRRTTRPKAATRSATRTTTKKRATTARPKRAAARATGATASRPKAASRTRARRPAAR